MKFKALSFLVALLFLIDATAQNLVPNPSFEDYTECPELQGGLNLVDHWYKSIIIPGNEDYENPSPDYFHECASGELFGVPENIFGTLNAYQGQAYAGAITYSTSFPNYREVIGVELTEPLVQGVTYNLSMRVSLALGTTSGWATNKLGMKLSMNEIFNSSEEAVNNFSHLYTEAIITDTINWTLIEGIIVADSPYQYLHIGNFFIGSETETVLLGGPFDNVAYYYIDDVRVIQEELVNIDSEAQIIPIQFGPNPVDDVLLIQSIFQCTSAEIYDINGKLLKAFAFNGYNHLNINVQHLNKGMYVLRVLRENGESQAEKFIKY
jgi:OmpA-OmpF porin, OOP family